MPRVAKMTTTLRLILLLLAAVLVTAAPRPHQPRSWETLQFLQVFFRHGDRSPSHPYDSDPNNYYWTEGFGQLTTLGMEQEYELGQYIRQRYTGYLNDSYYYENVYVKSSDVDRTLMSANTFLAGLYPPAADEVWNPAFPYQPIPIHTIPDDTDYWLDHEAPCPNYDDLLDDQKNSDEMKEIDDHYQSLYDLLTTETGEKVNDIFDVADLYDTFDVEIIHNLTMPTWLTPDVLTQMEECHNLKYVYRSKTQDMCRLWGGATLGMMIDYMKDHKNNATPNLQVALWSSHETMVASLLAAMGVFNGIAPPYSATVLMELHLQEGAYVVQTFYRNDTTTEPIEVVIPGCTSPCPYDMFHDLTDGVTPGSDIASECGA